MTQAILKTVARENPVSFEEVQAAYFRLNSIDAVIVAIELSVVTSRPFSDAIDVLCESSQVCAGEQNSYHLNV
jgi:hypothetical protein